MNAQATLSEPELKPAVAPPRKPQPPPKKSKHDRSTTTAFWLFMTPALLGLTVFTLIPIVWGFVLSLSHAQNTIRPVRFVGLANYIDLLTDEAFLRSLATIMVF